MKLAAKLMFVFLTVVILMTAVGSYFTVRRGFERFEKQQQQFAREAAETVREKLARGWQKDGAKGLLDAMQGIAEDDPRHQTHWVWFEHTEVTPSDSRAKVVEQWAGITSDLMSKTYTDEHGQRHLRTYYPIDLGSSPHGGLEVTGSLEPLDAAARETIVMALVSLGGVVLVSLGIVYIAGMRWVARPLQQLIDKTERIGQGDFDTPLRVRGNDELSQLARALNRMSQQLAAQQEKIRDETSARLATLEQLRHADRLKTVGRLAAGLAHELGTPLNVVSGRAGLIADGKLTDDEISASAKTIKFEAERVTGIIRQLLDFARPSKAQRERVNVGQLLNETTHLLVPLAEKGNVRIKIEHTDEISVSAHRGQLQQAFTNIVVNAIHSMPDGGDITINLDECEARSPDDDAAKVRRCAVARIRDHGVGIPPDNLEQIFEPFFTTKDVGEGTGLGLSITYGIIREHGGWIDVESEVGQGTCFAVYIPVE